MAPLWEPASWRNRSIATAKALVRYKDKPEGAWSGSWEVRYVEAARPWVIEERGAFLAKRAGAVVAGLVGGFLAAFLALALLAWTWCFLLARIRELSSAVRGK